MGTNTNRENIPSSRQNISGRKLIEFDNSFPLMPLPSMPKEQYDFLKEDLTADIKKSLTRNFSFKDANPARIEARVSYMLHQFQLALIKTGLQPKFIAKQNGYIRFYDKDKKEIYIADIPLLWDVSDLPVTELNKIHAKVRAEQEALRTTIERESRLGGSVVLQWSITAGYSTLLAEAATSPLRSQVRKTLGSILVRTPDGGYEKVFLGDRLQGKSAEWIKENTLKVLQSVGVYFDPIRKTCTDIGKVAVRATLDFLSKASLSEVREKYGVAITEAQLQQMRASARTGLSQLAKFGYSFAEFVKWSTGKGLHIVMFPVFFIYFQKQQNSATLMAGMAEWAAFSAGAKVGEVVGSRFGFLGRFGGQLIGGVSGVTGGHWLYEKAGGNRLKWQAFNGSDMFSNKNSTLLHFATGWGVNEYFDWLNDIGPRLSQKIGTSGGFDVGIPSMDAKKNLPGWMAKYGPVGALTGGGLKSLIGMGEGGTGFVPNIDFYKRKVSFQGAPWEWFNASVKGRTINKWNEQVRAYGDELSQKIGELLGAYLGNQPPFNTEKNKAKKREMLELRLGMLLLSPSIGPFSTYANNLHKAIMSESDSWNLKTSPGYLNSIIRNYTSFMLIDEEFARSNHITIESRVRKESNGTLSGTLIEDFDTLARQVKSPYQQAYLRNICKRVIFGDGKLFDNGETIDGRNYIPSPDENLFTEILASNIKVRKNILNPNNPNETITEELALGDAFAQLLDDLAYHCQLRKFQERIAKVDEKTGDVKLIHPERRGAHFTELEALRPTYDSAKKAVRTFFNSGRDPDKSVMDDYTPR